MMHAEEVALAEAREMVETLREWGADEQAHAAEKAIDLVEKRTREAEREPLPLGEAARESGYSSDHLGRLIREGTLPNAGESHAPRIRRKDLPRKPGHRVPVASGNGDSVPSKAQIARSVVNSDEGEDDG